MVLHEKFAFESLLAVLESRAYVCRDSIWLYQSVPAGAVKSIYGYVKSMKITIIMESI